MKNFIIDINLPVKERYKHILENFDLQPLSKELEKIYEDFLPKTPMINNFISLSMKSHKKEMLFKDEIDFWSKSLKLAFHKIVILQLIFEMNLEASSGSILENLKTKYIFLNNYIYEAEIYRDKTKLYDTISFPGLVGNIIGKNNVFETELQYKQIVKFKTSFDYMKDTFTKHNSSIIKYQPITYTLRQILENQKSYYEFFGHILSCNVFAPVKIVIKYKIDSICKIPDLIFEKDNKRCIYTTL